MDRAGGAPRPDPRDHAQHGSGASAPRRATPLLTIRAAAVSTDCVGTVVCVTGAMRVSGRLGHSSRPLGALAPRPSRLVPRVAPVAVRGEAGVPTRGTTGALSSVRRERRCVMASLSPAVVIVTGASGERGGEIARRLARRGFAIVAVYLEDQRGSDATVEAVFAAGSAGVAVRADVTDDLDVARLFDETVAAFGAADAVIHADPADGAVLFTHAARRLTRGGAVAAIVGSVPLPPGLARRLTDSGVVVNGVLAGLGTADGDPEQAIDDPVAFLDRWRERRSRG